MSDSIVETKISKVLDQFQPDQVWVGFSGGLDSTALLAAAKKVQQRHYPRIDLRAVHINHNLHADSEDWVSHCADVCTRLDVPLEQPSVQVSQAGNLEANARLARYAEFERRLTPTGLLFLGHHQQDQSETILYRLLQGRGMLAMRDQGPLGQGHFVRPLIRLPRRQLELYVRENKLSWVEDPSNADVTLQRNFLRSDILPRLLTRWQDVDGALLRVAQHHESTFDALVDTLSHLPDEFSARRLPQDPLTRRVWLRAYLTARGVFSVSDRGLDDFIVQQGHAAVATLRLDEASLYRYQDTIYFESKLISLPAPQALQAPVVIQLPYGELHLRAADPAEPMAFVAQGALQLDFRQGGETIKEASSGLTKPLKQLFNEAQMPPWRRSSYPLIFSRHELICVPEIAVRRRPVHSQSTGSASWLANFQSKA